jgi:ribokinase
MRTAVVGHLEWSEFLPVERIPLPGEILETTDCFEEPAGGGAVAAVQLTRLAGQCTFFTALGDDYEGREAERRLRELGVDVHVAWRPGRRTRRAFVYLDSHGERTITTIGDRLCAERPDPLPWDELAEADAVYFVAGDEGALHAAREARVVVATSRIIDLLDRADVPLDAVVGSARDAGERYRPIDPAPDYVISTMGSEGGRWTDAQEHAGRWAAQPLPGPRADAYGAGDSFAGGLTYALGAGYGVEAAIELASRCGAACMTGRGPYEGQLTRAET